MDWMGLIKIGTAKNTKNSLGKISLAQKKSKILVKKYHKNWHRKKFQKQMWKKLRSAKKSKKKV